ncbi:hypothetical protein IJ843_04815 [bacterium]|nr:hypothetical protein [bacterium]
MEKTFKKTILIDLDGVLNEYTGNFDKNYIPQIKEGAKNFIEKLSENFEIKLFTTRNKILATKWIIENNLDSYILDVTDKKDLCWLFIDDRCINFKGNYESLYEQIENFKPWYK